MAILYAMYFLCHARMTLCVNKERFIRSQANNEPTSYIYNLLFSLGQELVVCQRLGRPLLQTSASTMRLFQSTESQRSFVMMRLDSQESRVRLLIFSCTIIKGNGMSLDEHRLNTLSH